MQIHSSGRRDFVVLEFETSNSRLQLSEGQQGRGIGEAHFSILIGPNGVGKSRLLAQVVDHLVALNDMRSRRPIADARTFTPWLSASGQSLIRYRLDGQECTIETAHGQVTCEVNGNRAHLDEMPFPKKVIAVAHLPVDRFRFGRPDQTEFYAYLGLRQATNLTTTGALESKVIAALMRGAGREGYLERVRHWLTLVQLGQELHVTFGGINPELWNCSTWDSFVDTAREVVLRRIGRGRRFSSQIEKLNNELPSAWYFFETVKSLSAISSESKSRGHQFTFDASSFAKEGAKLAIGLEVVRRWRFVSEALLGLRKAQERISFNQLSSGEQQLVGTHFRVQAEMEHGTLVAIDEPEVSLHPSWQTRYVETFRTTLKDFPATHVILGTHSHFMVSDAKPPTSTVVVPKTGEAMAFEAFRGPVYGRSPENVLYRVFGTGAVSNFYVERDLAHALKMISGVIPLDKTELMQIEERLRSVVERDNPALDKIFIEIERAMR
ncbi:AAA ATPase-like protein [Burkholderia sp. SJZ115]|nr:AAA ATPase-like protein [Burkholderia sp. SJZ089]TWC96785.1 AAA ATPase-like protein [Burkholderia sp. SJZ115]TWD00478.1 AAA ATPase-like protein [Burkholderia sp. SJZ091]